MIKEEREKLPRDIVVALSAPIKDIDAEIYKITKVRKTGKADYYVVEFAFPESMGEHGFLQTAFFDELPDVSEIRRLCINEMKDFVKSANNFWADAYEEEAVKKMKKILLKL